MANVRARLIYHGVLAGVADAQSLYERGRLAMLKHSHHQELLDQDASEVT